MGTPGTLERREWELGRGDGYHDEESCRISFARASRSPYYFAGYKEGIEAAKLQALLDAYTSDPDELNGWQF